MSQPAPRPLSARQAKRERMRARRESLNDSLNPQSPSLPPPLPITGEGGNALVWGLVVVFLVTLACYARAVGFEFVSDDRVHIQENALLNPVSAAGALSFWTQPYFQLYIPATYSLWALLAALFGVSNPAPFHALNILLHAGNAALVFVLLVKISPPPQISPTPLFSKRGPIQGHDPRMESPLAKGGAPTARGFERRFAFALLGALLFALHPLQVEAVAWVSGMRDLLGAFFGLLALLGLVAAMAQPKGSAGFWGRTLFAGLAFFLSLASKPSMVVLPLIAALLLHWRAAGAARFWSKPQPALVLSLLPWLLLAAFWVWLTGQAQSAADLAKDLVALWQRPLVALDAFAFYLAKLVWPWPLSADYGRSPNFIAANGQLYWTWLLPAALAILAFWKAGWGMRLAYAIFLIALLPTSGLVAFNFQLTSTVADRYAYFALLGVALAVGLGVQRWCKRSAVVMAAALLVFGVVGQVRMGDWQRAGTLAQATFRANPLSMNAYHDYVTDLYEAKDYAGCVRLLDGALEHLKQSRLPSNVGLKDVYNDLGACALAAGDGQKAEWALRRALEVSPFRTASLNLGMVLLQNGKPLEAVEVYRQALRPLNKTEKPFGELYHQMMEAAQVDDAAIALKLAWILAAYPDTLAKTQVRNCREAIDLMRTWRPPGDTAAAAQWRMVQAVAHAACNERPAALKTASEAMEIYRKLNNSAEAARIARVLTILASGGQIQDESLLHPFKK